MNTDVKEYIEHYIHLIEEGEFLLLYRGLSAHLRSELTEVLHTAGIHPETIMEIIPSGFAMNSNTIDKVTTSNNCTIIGANAFKGSSLSEIHLGQHIHQIETEAFSFCNNLTSIDIPDSVRVIDEDAFLDCRHLRSVKLSRNLEQISKFMFHQCYTLSSLTIPLSVFDIGNHAFCKCNFLTEIRYEGTMKQWGSIDKGDFWNKGSYIEKVRCKDGTISIE